MQNAKCKVAELTVGKGLGLERMGNEEAVQSAKCKVQKSKRWKRRNENDLAGTMTEDGLQVAGADAGQKAERRKTDAGGSAAVASTGRRSPARQAAFFLQPEGNEVRVVGEREAFTIQSQAAAECGQRSPENAVPPGDFSAARQRASAGQRA